MPNKDWIDLMKVKPVDKSGANSESDDADMPVKNRDRVREFIDSLPSVQLGNRLDEEDELENEKLKAEHLRLKKLMEEKTVTKTPVVAPEIKESDWRDTKAGLNLQSEKLGATGTAVFGQIPMPDKPETPNVLVGMVTDTFGKIVEEVIVEIQDEKGNPSRVLKTNSLGQFKTTTPLANGKYLVISDKEGLVFDRVSVELTGKIVEPIKIMAKI
jgi:hypothetical protein